MDKVEAPSQFAEVLSLVARERARHGSSPVTLRRCVLSLEKGNNLIGITLFAGLSPALAGDVIEETESSGELKQKMRRQMSN